MAAGNFNYDASAPASAPAPAAMVPRQMSGLLSGLWVVYDAGTSGISALPGVVGIGVYTADEFVALMRRAAPIFAQTDRTRRGEMPPIDDDHNPSFEQLRRLAGWAGAWGVYPYYTDAYEEAELRGLIPVETADPFHLDADDDTNVITDPAADHTDAPVLGIPVQRS